MARHAPHHPAERSNGSPHGNDDVHYTSDRSMRNDYEQRDLKYRNYQYDSSYDRGDKDYARRYGREPEERRTIYTTKDYDDDYLNRRLHSGR